MKGAARALACRWRTEVRVPDGARRRIDNRRQLSLEREQHAGPGSHPDSRGGESEPRFGLSPAPLAHRTMTKVCAWCGKRLVSGGSVISHGICAKCFGAIFQESFEFLEVMPAQVAARGNRRRFQRRLRDRKKETRQAVFEFGGG